jgi:predicted porin
MKFTKTTLAAALLTTLPISAFAAEELTFYGKANVTVQSSDDGSGSVTEINSNASRLGVKGSHALEGNLEVVYQAEFEVHMDDGKSSSSKGSDTFEQRNVFVGIKGDFGTVLVGKRDTALKKSQGKIDLFSDLNGDIKNLWQGENRESNSIVYLSPSFNGFTAGLTYVASEEDGVDDGISAAVNYGDEKLKKSSYFVSVAMDSDVDEHDVIRVSGQTKLGDVTLGAIFHSEEDSTGGGDMDGIMISAKYSIDKVTLKGQFQTAEYDVGDDQSGFTAGADYKLSGKAKLFTYYTTFDMDSGADQDYLAAGIEYKF